MNGKIYASMKSIASYIPKNCVSNEDFEKIIDTSDEWIVKRTGIKTRYFADPNESTSDLGFKAAKLAIERAGITANDLDIVIAATISPDHLSMPSTACQISYKLGIEGKPALDISAACSGFIYLLNLARSYIESGIYKNILIVGCERISSILDFTDRSTCVLFGDGAGAAVISPTNDPKKSIVDVHLGSNGRYGDFLMTPRLDVRKSDNFSALGKILSAKSSEYSSLEIPQQLKQCVHMSGNETFKLAVETLSSDVQEIMQKNNLNSEDVDFFIPHQANLRIISAVGKRLDFADDKIVVTVDKYGNTSAASIPMAMDDIYNQGKLKNGDLMVLDAFGGGFTWGSAIVYFDGK